MIGRAATSFVCNSLLAFALSCSFGQAQTTTSGALAGTVTDSTGAVLPGAGIEIKDLAKGSIQSTKTNHTGVYTFSFLAPGFYTLTARAPSFREESRNVEIRLGAAGTLNLSLEPAKARTVLQVTADAEPIQAENGDVSATMNQKQISELPNPGNDLTYVVQTAPGVVMNTDIQGGANFSILGMTGFSYLHTMNGMDDNDNGVNLSQFGAVFLLPGQNQVQEATVVTNGYSGQFGGAAGGNINYITKSGSNQFHGNAQYYWNSRILNANDWFLKAQDKPRPFSIAHQWAASLGGPLHRDKLFFFADTEGLRILIPNRALVTIPSLQFETATLANLDADPRFGPGSATDSFYRAMFNLYKQAPGAGDSISGASFEDHLGCVGFSDPGSGLGIDQPCSRFFFASRGRPSQDALISGRLDFNFSESDRAFVRVQRDSGRGAIATDLISPLFDADALVQPWWQAQILETHTFASSSANQFLIAGSYFNNLFSLKTTSAALAAFPTTLNFVSGPFTGLGGPANFLAYGLGRHNLQYQLSDDFTRIFDKHQLRIGVNIERIDWNELPPTSGNVGHLDVLTLDAFFRGGIDLSSPSTDFTLLTQSFTSHNNLPISFFNAALYADDEWRIRPNLSVTAALRAEHYSNPVCRTRCFARLAAPFEQLDHDPTQGYDQAIRINQSRAFENTDPVLWSPRLSFAWQPFGASRKGVFRGGVGIFYDPIPGGIVSSFSGNPPLLNTFTIERNNLAPNETSSLFRDATNSNAAFVNGFKTGQSLQAGQFPPAVNGTSRVTHSPQYQRWNLQWQQELGNSTSLNVGYFGYHGVHGLVLNSNANAYGFGSLPSRVCASPPVPPCADARFSEVTEVDSNAISNYAGMVASFTHHFSRWSHGIFQANYTLGHALDEVSSSGGFIFTGASITTPQDPNNPRGSYGSADQDVRHSFNANYVWDVPLKQMFAGHGGDFFVQGWQISGTVFARTGFPYTVLDFDSSGALVGNNYFGLLYAVPAGPPGPNLPCGAGAAFTNVVQPCQIPQLSQDGSTPSQQARFLQAGCITDFNQGHLPGPSGPCRGGIVSFAQGRNRFRTPGYFNTDLTITKSTKIPGREGVTLGIGFQFFNLFNHPNFAFPDPGVGSPTFGQIFNLEQPPTSILGSGFGGDASPRMIQVKTQLQF